MAATPQDPRLRRFTHPEADVVWAGIEALSQPLKHEVLRELATAVAIDVRYPRTAPQKIRKAVAALHQAFDLIGHSPSVKEYRQICKLLPEIGLPPESNVRSWLGGGWNDCLSRALLPAVSDGDFSELPTGGTFQEAELHDALRACAADLGRRPFFSEYRTWAANWNEDGRSPRRPASHSAFDRFGGFLAVLLALGMIDRDEATRDALNRVIPATHEYEENDLNEAIHIVKEHLGLDRAPRVAEYTRGRREVMEQRIAAGVMRPLPTSATITKKRTWDEALVRAGLEALGGKTTSSNPGRRRPSYTDEECLGALRTAWTAIGEPFTAEAYTEWRKKEIARIVADEGVPHIPGCCTIGERFRGWARGCLKAIPGYTPDPKRIRPNVGRLPKSPTAANVSGSTGATDERRDDEGDAEASDAEQGDADTRQT